VTLHANAPTPKRHAFELEAKPLLETLLAVERDSTPGGHHAMPRQSGPGPQGPHREPSRAGVTGRRRDLAVGDHAALRDGRDDVPESRQVRPPRPRHAQASGQGAPMKYANHARGRKASRLEVTGRKLTHFYQLAEYYDSLNDWKDYAAESRRLESLARRFGRKGRTSWLDVACGTGLHLSFLQRNYAVEGVDASPDMLRVARRRLPNVRLVRGDMRHFRLGRTFDVVSCLFSAIGHLATTDDVRAAFSNFRRHLNPGGVVIVEPWLQPSQFRAGSIHLRAHSDAEMAVARMASSARRGNRSIIHFHFLVGNKDHGVRYYDVTDVGLMLSRAELVRAMREAGLEPRFLTQGFTGRGLLIGTWRENGRPTRARSSVGLGRGRLTSRAASAGRARPRVRT
jgi:ubiquinone/menaquinone biosynthesis C-methylase UbiE